MTTFYVTAEMAILINQKVILEHSTDEQTGVKDHARLDSALKSPQPSFFGEDAYELEQDRELIVHMLPSFQQFLDAAFFACN